jgi:hypothetical protein
MEPSSHPTRALHRLSDSLHHRLDMYAIAAGAAGVGMVALTQAAEAKIIYTKVHQVIAPNGIYPLDVNNDGTIDFLIEQSTSWYRLAAQGALGNGIAAPSGKSYVAAALKEGTTIGPSDQLWESNSWVQDMVVKACPEGGTRVPNTNKQQHAQTNTCYTSGPWADVENRYLGLRFKIGGKAHYGWARLTVHTEGFQSTAALTGYAYETVAGKAIHAGQIIDLDAPERRSSAPSASVGPGQHWEVGPASSASEAVGLDTLALGAGGLASRRKQ